MVDNVNQQIFSDNSAIKIMKTLDDAIDAMVIDSEFSILDLTQKKKAEALPDAYAMTLDKLTDLTFGDGKIGKQDVSKAMANVSDEGKFSVSIYKGCNPMNVPGFLICVGMDNDLDNLFPSCLTPWDRCVFWGVCSILLCGATYFTGKQVLNVLSGRITTDHGTSKALQDVNKSISKMMSATVMIDWSDVIRFHGYRLKSGASCMSQTNVLPLRRWYARRNNSTASIGYEVIAEPELLRFAKVLKQIGVADIRCLKSSNNRSERDIVIRNYLLKRAVQYKDPNNKKASPVINIDTVIQKCNLFEDAKHQRTLYRIKNDIYRAMDDFQRLGLIDGYKKRKTGHEVIDVIIQ